MKKQEVLNQFRIDKIGTDTVFIQNKFFNFSYTVADSVVKEELKGKYKYFGGLQCDFEQGSEEYKNLEKWLIEIADITLKF